MTENEIPQVLTEEKQPLFVIKIKDWAHIVKIFTIFTPIITSLFTGAVYLYTLKLNSDVNKCKLNCERTLMVQEKEYESRLKICDKSNDTKEFAIEVIILRYLAEYNKTISEWEDDKVNIVLNKKLEKTQSKLAAFIYSTRKDIIKKKKDISIAEKRIIMSSAYIDLNGRRYLIPQNVFMIIEALSEKK